jgi:hypothetical protein
MARDGHSVVPLKGVQRAGPAGRLLWASIFLLRFLMRLSKNEGARVGATGSAGEHDKERETQIYPAT